MKSKVSLFSFRLKNSKAVQDRRIIKLSPMTVLFMTYHNG